MKMDAPTGAANLRLQQHATRAAFFIPGWIVAAWAPLVPYAKSRTGLDDASFGLAILCLGLGSIITMPLAGALAAKRGCRIVMLAAVVVMALTLPLLTIVSSFTTLCLTLLCFGAGMGAMDCVMNLQAVVVEKRSSRPVMSGFHAFFSLGGLCGAIAATLMLSASLGILAMSFVCVAIAIIVTIGFSSHWLREHAESGGAFIAFPRGIVILLGVVCFIAFLSEGAMLDWSAIYIHEIRHIDATHAGWGFVAFNLAMTFCRVVGDRLVAALGRRTTLIVGGVAASGGLMLALTLPSFQLSLVGYVLLGLGCANMVPVMFSMIGQQHRMPESVAVPAVTSLGYAGVLAGPALIGFIAQLTSLPLALAIVAVALLVATALGVGIQMHLARGEH